MPVATCKMDMSPPTEQEIALAKDSSRLLARHVSDHEVRVRVQSDGGPGETVTIPQSAFRMLMEILSQMSQGNAITIIPVHAELSTQQAADILNVSRPFAAKLMDEGKIPSRMVGKHRRVLFQDLMVYRRQSDEARRKALADLVAEAQELDMGY